MPRYCLLFNPRAGRRSNERLIGKLRATFGADMELRPTTGPGAAETMAADAAREGFGCVVAAGGDGTVHEVGSGLLESGARDVVLGVFPVGSANDYAHSLRREFGDEARGPERAVAVDVGRVTGLSDQPSWFLNSIGVGFTGAVTCRSRSIRWLRGIPLYGLATLQALWWDFSIAPWTVALDGGAAENWPTLMFSALLGRREGNFVLAPDARLADGWFDYVHAGALSRWNILRLLPSLAKNGPPRDFPQVRQGRCRSIEITSPVPLAAHIDGEIVSRVEHGRSSARIEIVPQRLRAAVFEAGSP